MSDSANGKADSGMKAAQARAKAAGVELHLSPRCGLDSVVTVSRWGLVREFSTLADAEKLLDRMGVPA